MKTSIRGLALGTLLASALSLSATSVDAAACAYQTIAYGQTVNGSLSTTDCTDDYADGSIYYIDYYQFTGTAGDKIYIQQTSSSIDPWLMLIYPSGNYSTDNNGGGGTTARIPAASGYYTLPESGTYLLGASNYDPPLATGSYTLQLVKEGSPSSTSQGSLLTVIEFYNSNYKHYFMTSDPLEAVGIDQGSAGPAWSRTGYTFKAFSRVNPPANTNAVCRFYGTPGVGPNSHFFTARAGECALVKTDPHWTFEGNPYYSVPVVGNSCSAGTVPLYRAYNNRFDIYNDANHRFTTSQTVYQEMIAQGWIGEGIVMCVNATSSSGSATEQAVRQMVDNTLTIITGAGGAGITTQLESILSSLSNPASSTCPVVTSDPPISNLETLPPSLTVSLNYGTGCTASDGSTMSGGVTLQLSNLSLSAASSSSPITVSGNFSLVLDKLRKNWVLLGNGQVAGNANLAISLSSSSGQSSGSLNIQLTNLVLSTGTLINGTVALTVASNTQQNASINLSTSNGPIVLALQLTENSSNDVITVNSTSPGTVGNYSAQISNLQMNPAVCENYPVGGTISFTKSGQTSTVTFNGSCDGNYSYTGP